MTGDLRLGLVEWTAEEESAVGREQVPDVESLFDATVIDAKATATLGEIVAEMVEHSVRRDDFEFCFKILNSSTPNAFALPGGFVYITRGLLELIETEGQFVSILGHEIGHVEHQHSMRNVSRGRVRRLLTSPMRLSASLTEGLPGGRIVGLAAGLASAPFALMGLRFNRGQELESDLRGLHFAASMGYDPRDSLRTFRLFERLEGQAASGELSWLRSHPLNDERIERSEAVIRERYPEAVGKTAQGFRRSSEAFEAVIREFRDRAPAFALHDEAVSVISKADATPEDYAEALQKLGEAVEQLPDEPLFLISWGELAFAGEKFDLARELLSRAESLYAEGDGHWKTSFYLGISELLERRFPEAVQLLALAHTRFPSHTTVRLFLGHAYEGAQDVVNARSSYKAVVESEPNGSALRKEAEDRLAALGQ